VRVTGNAAFARRTLDEVLADVDPGAVEQIHTLDLYRAAQVYPFVATHWVSSAVGVIALLLTLTGIYGVLSYVVAQRRRELGIRMALGASTGTIVGLVMRHALRLAAIGLAVGCVLAVGVSGVFASNMLMLDTFDPLAYTGAAAMVLVACLIATYVPSRRAASVQPMEALRSD
jgi:ABC-type antimicrobial peptide transport system permease subunit